MASSRRTAQIIKFSPYTKEEALVLICFAIDRGIREFDALLPRRKNIAAKVFIRYLVNLIGEDALLKDEDFLLSLILLLGGSGSERAMHTELRLVFSPAFAAKCCERLRGGLRTLIPYPPESIYATLITEELKRRRKARDRRFRKILQTFKRRIRELPQP